MVLKQTRHGALPRRFKVLRKAQAQMLPLFHSLCQPNALPPLPEKKPGRRGTIAAGCRQGRALAALALLFAHFAVCPSFVTAGPAPVTMEADLCIYGGTACGVVAAVQAASMGRHVVLLEPGTRLGGMTTGGLGATDIGNKAAIGGLSRDFYRNLGRHYGQTEAWKFEPHAAEEIIEQMVRRPEIETRRGQILSSVNRSGNRLLALRTTDGSEYRAKVFIDASYEGDLMARAGVSFTIGRESNAQYNETLNGIRDTTPFHQFLVPVDPWVKPGDPASGLLRFIQAGAGGRPGDGDRRVQTYNLRLCFTTNAANRLPLPRPARYAPADYELLLRYIEAMSRAGRALRLEQLWNPIWLPNGKTDINNNGPFSTDFIGENYEYPGADEAVRARIRQRHLDYTRGFCYFLATDPRVPAALRAQMNEFGPCQDEFTDSGGWPSQLYIREARRMVTDYVMTEHHCRAEVVASDPVGLAAYNMDSHNCQRVVQNGFVRNEGDVQVPPMKPYGVSYRAIVPRRSECGNLLVPVCLAATHIAYGSIRMEPVFMILGQSAATAAAQAIEEGRAVQDVDYGRLRNRLLQDRQILAWPPSNF